MDDQKKLILGTAGHIDHGKSALVQALTGTDPDRLAEEKRRGITIEIGFAQLVLPDASTMGVVDVPGHERFVRHMISGATGIDIALLCIAADDGIMPQTREHLDILELLAIDTCIVALTKKDLVDAEWLELVSEEIKSELSSRKYADCPIIPCSSKTGEGIEDIKFALIKARELHIAHKTSEKFRLPIDRVFSVKGSGTVVTGTLWGGSISCDDEVEVLPSGKRSRVRSIQIHDVAQECAQAGNRVALNLSSLALDQVRPGDFLIQPQTLASTDRFDALYTHLDSQGRGKALKSGSRVRVAHGTKEVMARLLRIDSDEALKPQTQARVQIRLEEPLAIARNDHFVIRSYSPVRVIGGGSVLQAHPRRRTHLKKSEQALFEALEQRNISDIIAGAACTKQYVFTAHDIAYEFDIDDKFCVAELSSLCANKKLIELVSDNKSVFYIQAAVLQKLFAKIDTALINYHGAHSDEPGISKNALRRKLGIRLTEAAFDALLSKAEAAGKIVNHRGIISHPEIGAGIQQKEEKAAEKLYETFERHAQSPATVDEIIAETKLERGLGGRVLTNLEEEGRVIRVSKDYYFDHKAYELLRDKVIDYLQKHGFAQASELKNTMGLSRKHAIPLLEYFDEQGITRREGDLRSLAD